jgi:hypothetical protein
MSKNPRKMTRTTVTTPRCRTLDLFPSDPREMTTYHGRAESRGMADNLNSPPKNPAPDSVRVYVAEQIARYGVRQTATRLGLTRHIVSAVAAGAPVHAGTRLMAIEAARARGIDL